MVKRKVGLSIKQALGQGPSQENHRDWTTQALTLPLGALLMHKLIFVEAWVGIYVFWCLKLKKKILLIAIEWLPVGRTNNSESALLSAQLPTLSLELLVPRKWASVKPGFMQRCTIMNLKRAKFKCSSVLLLLWLWCGSGCPCKQELYRQRLVVCMGHGCRESGLSAPLLHLPALQ